MSNRLVWPYVFTLQTTPLLSAYQRGADFASVAPPKLAIDRFGIPVALRWLTTPELGFPRQPFQVFKRARTNIPAGDILNLLAAPVQNPGLIDIAFPAALGLMYLVAFTAEVTSAQSLSVYAYDYNGNLIPGLGAQILNSSFTVWAYPGIAGLRVYGNGTLASVFGVNQDVYANLPGWERIQIVGLPVEPNELGAHYNSAIPQGYEGALTTGFIAAYERLLIADLCTELPPLTGDPSFPLPLWPPALPLGYLDNLRASGNLYRMIAQCLEHTNDANAAQMQVQYSQKVNIAGITQANLPPGQTPAPTNPSTATIPVVGVSMVGIGTDSNAATGLGYGTIDLPALDTGGFANAREAADAAAAQETAYSGAQFAPQFAVRGSTEVLYDYMVTSPYILPGGLEVLLAALSQPAAPVQTAADFSANLLVTHAVITRDTPAQTAVELSWQPPSVPQAYGLLASRTPGQAVVLNTARPASVHGYTPYLGLAPDTPAPGQSPADTLPNYKDAAGHLPITGNATTRYLAAGIDVFGRWSPWTPASVQLSAAPVTQPGLRTIAFTPGPLPSSGTKVPYTLSIEVAWDWTDRSPGVIRITGQFVGKNAGLGPAYLSGLALSNDGPPGAPLLLTWNYGSADPATVAPDLILPGIDSAHAGTVTLANDPPAPGQSPTNAMRYRVNLDNLTLDFAGNDSLYLAIYATASESVRPGEWSSPVDANAPPTAYIGRIVRVHNPLPPILNFTPPAINWTALPDAMQKAHGILAWNTDPSAAGYMVWEATESGLLQLLSPSNPDPAPPPTTLVTRGQTLKNLVANNYPACLAAFSRLNTTPITGSSYEIEVPGKASVLYAYMVSAVSSQGVEVERQPQIAVFGVPYRKTPGQPRLRLRTAVSSGGTWMQIIALYVQSGEIPAGYRVYRVRDPALATDAGLMGPPKILDTDPGWSPFSEPTLPGLVQPAARTPATALGQSIVDLAAGPSWYPYYYRIDAIGPQDPGNGIYSGWSLPSQVQTGYNTPPDPPLISAPPSLSTGNGGELITFTTDLPIAPSPLGPALVELLQASPDPANPGRMIQTTLVSLAPGAINPTTLTLPPPAWHFPPPGPHPLPGHGLPIHGYTPQPVKPALARNTPDSSGQWSLSALVPIGASQAGTYSIRLTDPLGRQNSTVF